MKKSIALLLALVLALSLTACGGKEEAAAQVTTAAAETQQATAPVETVPPTTQAPTEAPTEAPTQAPEEDSLFDTSWASNDFEKLIPQPPFTGWTAEQAGPNLYKMYTNQANPNNDLSYYDTFAAYVQTLTECDFAMEGNEYVAHGWDPMGNYIELMCGDGACWIMLETVEPVNVEETAAPVEAAPAAAAPGVDGWNVDGVVLPMPEPPFPCDTGYNASQEMYIAYIQQDISFDTMVQYCGQLWNAGFTDIRREVLTEDVYLDELNSTGACTVLDAKNSEGYQVIVYQEESTQMIWVYLP